MTDSGQDARAVYLWIHVSICSLQQVLSIMGAGSACQKSRGLKSLSLVWPPISCRCCVFRPQLSCWSSTALQSPSPSGDQLGLLIIADLILPKLLVWPLWHDNLVMLHCDGQYACSSGKADDGSSLHVGVVGDGELWSYLKFTGGQQYRYILEVVSSWSSSPVSRCVFEGSILVRA